MDESKSVLEEGFNMKIDFDKLQTVVGTEADVLPVAVQDVDSKRVLMIGYANELAVSQALSSGVAVFWSTSRNEMWVKGETSGDKLELLDVRVNCEQNSLLYLVRLRGKGACHTKENGKTRETCYYRSVSLGPSGLRVGPIQNLCY